MKGEKSAVRRILLVLVLAPIAGALGLHVLGSTAFQPYFGSINPVLGTGAVAVVAVAALSFLQSHDWLAVDRASGGLTRFALPALLATLLAGPVIIADMAGAFPYDLNVLPPEGLLFYPTIAVVAETVFHVAPLALLLSVLPRLITRPSRDVLLVSCLFLVALSEPVFQVAAGIGDSPTWASVFVGVHLAVFSLSGLWLYYRHGFLSLLTLRLSYYFWWHIVWGIIRLRVVG